MVLLQIEGFEHGDILAAAIASAITNSNFRTGVSRSGSGARILAVTNVEEWFTKHTDCPTNSEIHCGFAVRTEAELVSANLVVISGMQTGGSSSADSSCLQFAWDSGGVPRLYVKGDGNDVDDSADRIGSPIVGSTNDILPQTWHYIEIRWLPHASAGETELWIDGVSIGSTSGTDTLGNTTTTQIDEVWMIFTGHTTTSNNECYYDDIYVTDSDTTSPLGGTSPNVGKLGQIVIEALVPDADNTPEDWALQAGGDSFAMVDEIPHDTDTTYIESSTVNNETRLDLAARVHTGTVVGVQTRFFGRKTTGNPRTLDSGVVSNAGATKNTAETDTLAETYNLFGKLYERDPHDGTAEDWNTTKVDALEVFVEVAS